MSNPPSKRTLKLLSDLGYAGQAPTSSKQAFAAIEALQAGGGFQTAEDALTAQRLAEERDDPRSPQNRLKWINDRIAHLIEVNRDFGGEGLYWGFLLNVFDDEPTEGDAPYVGAYVSLAVAQQFPEVLIRDVLDCEEVTMDDPLPAGGKVVIAPGQFGTLPVAAKRKGRRAGG